MEKIIFADGTEFTAAPQGGMTRPQPGREWRAFRITAAPAEARASFIPGASYRREWQSAATGENGETVTETLSEELSAWSVAGDVCDSGDGSVTVYMGKPTETELLSDALDELMLLVLGGEDE